MLLKSPLTRTERYKQTIQKMVLSRLSPDRIWELRREYEDKLETIADLSARTGVPPVLLWSALTPLYEKVQIKHKLLQLEIRIYDLLARNFSRSWIADELMMTETDVDNYTVDQFSDTMFRLRSWYCDQHASASSTVGDERWEYFTEANLPPASRIGWKAGDLAAIPEDRLGRCPTCGEKVHLPCYACALKEYLKENKISQAAEVSDADDEEEPLPSLMFR